MRDAETVLDPQRQRVPGEPCGTSERGWGDRNRDLKPTSSAASLTDIAFVMVTVGVSMRESWPNWLSITLDRFYAPACGVTPQRTSRYNITHSMLGGQSIKAPLKELFRMIAGRNWCSNNVEYHYGATRCAGSSA